MARQSPTWMEVTSAPRHQRGTGIQIRLVPRPVHGGVAFAHQIGQEAFRVPVLAARVPAALGGLDDCLRRESASAMSAQAIGHQQQKGVSAKRPQDLHSILVLASLPDVRELVHCHRRPHRFSLVVVPIGQRSARRSILP